MAQSVDGTPTPTRSRLKLSSGNRALTATTTKAGALSAHQWWCSLQAISAVRLVVWGPEPRVPPSLRTVRIWTWPSPLQFAGPVLTWRVRPARTRNPSTSRLPNDPHWPCSNSWVSMCMCTVREVLQRIEPLPVIWSLASVGAAAVSLQRAPTLAVPARLESRFAVLPPAVRSETTSANAAHPLASFSRPATRLSFVVSGPSKSHTTRARVPSGTSLLPRFADSPPRAERVTVGGRLVRRSKQGWSSLLHDELPDIGVG